MPLIPIVAAGIGFGAGLLTGSAFDKAMKLVIVTGVAYIAIKQVK